jgi:putative flippase GtrA
VIEKIKALLIKHREIIVYLIVGGITTVISWAAKFIWNFAFYEGTAFPTVTQNFILSMVNLTSGVLAAYPMNRRWVFQSKNPRILSEFGGFVASRVATLILDIVVMQVLVLIGVNMYIATIISAVLVIIGNYVFSKFFVFKNKKA